jgi:diguanylate cyclase (GGDEF)-like protein
MESYLKTPIRLIDIIDKLSDITRIVDPQAKKVLTYGSKKTKTDELRCFNFWGKNKVCDNCISMRAYNDNCTYVKIEYLKDRIYMVTAVPYDLDDRRIVVEILKDITNSMFFSTVEGADLTGIHALIDNMNRLAFSDPLTGLYNRRYIGEKLPVDLMNSALLSKELSVIMADVDYFKKVNDTYGHIAGDYTLKHVADTLKSCLKRGSDWIARFGGEEFLVCLPNAGLEVAKSTAERMRSLIEKQTIRFEDKQINVTVSFGIAAVKPDGNESAEALIKRADDKLYSAKKNGRNRVES